VTALTFKAAIDDPARFAESKTVGAHFGLTPKGGQSGTSIDHDGHISRCGDAEVRTALYEAANAMMTRSQKHCAAKAWGLRLAAKRGHKRALVAVARKLAVIIHRMWLDGSEFSFAASTEPKGERRLGEGMALGCGRDGRRIDTSSAGWGANQAALGNTFSELNVSRA
jgi:hypothetical protein